MEQMPSWIMAICAVAAVLLQLLIYLKTTSIDRGIRSYIEARVQSFNSIPRVSGGTGGAGGSGGSTGPGGIAGSGGYGGGGGTATSRTNSTQR